MNKWIKISFWVVFVVATSYGLMAVNTAINEQLVKKPDIQIAVDGAHAFLDEADVLTLLERENLLYAEQQFKDLNTELIESRIKQLPSVKEVEVFKGLTGAWHIKIQLRKPIAKIHNFYGDSYYLDGDGFTMVAQEGRSARVLTFNGFIFDQHDSLSVHDIINNDSLISIRKLDDMYRISNYVCNNPLMQSLVGQVYREKDGDFLLIPIVGGQVINFGTAKSDEEVAEKFRKLEIFYKEAIPYEGWNKYKEISLKYKGQIVCTKNE